MRPSSTLRTSLLYLAGLAVAAGVVFALAFFLGRRQNLELAPPPPPPPRGASSGIPSLRSPEPEPEPQEAAVPDGQALGEGAWVTRLPRPAAALLVGVDLAALTALESPGESGPRPLRDGLQRFFEAMPPGLRVGLRSLGSPEGACGGTSRIKSVGVWSAEELSTALEAAPHPGPRNPLQAVEEGSADLAEVAAEGTVVILAGGADGCGVDLCGAELSPSASSSRIHVVLLAPAPTARETLPDASAPPVFEPPWAQPYRCLAERGRGTFAVAASPEELAAHLLRIARSLESLLVVRAFHFTGREALGKSPEGDGGWRVSLEASRDGEPDGGLAQEEDSLPSVFAVPGGTYVLRSRYGAQEKTVAVAVAPQERAEVRLDFATGELFVQVRDESGNELVGDTAGFRCIWGAELLAPGAEKTAGSTCRFPARFELPPGDYRLRVWWKGKERILEDILVEGAQSTLRTVDFSGD